jgi:hypothetical protein
MVRIQLQFLILWDQLFNLNRLNDLPITLSQSFVLNSNSYLFSHFSKGHGGNASYAFTSESFLEFRIYCFSVNSWLWQLEKSVNTFLEERNFFNYFLAVKRRFCFWFLYTMFLFFGAQNILRRFAFIFLEIIVIRQIRIRLLAKVYKRDFLISIAIVRLLALFSVLFM